jgi:hypothetical protein
MQSYPQRGKSTLQPAIWLRMIAVLCIVMVTFMSAAQSCHTHAEASSLRQGSQHHQPAPEDHCPVCMAMHSAIPATAQGSQATIIDGAQYLVPLPAVEAHGTIRSFDLQTRPPPSA